MMKKIVALNKYNVKPFDMETLYQSCYTLQLKNEEELPKQLDKKISEKNRIAARAHLCGDYKLAIKLRLEIKKKVPNDFDNNYDLIRAYNNAGKYSNSVIEAEAMLKYEPYRKKDGSFKRMEMDNICLLLGDAYYQLKKYDNALSAYNAALTISSSESSVSILANYALGTIYLGKKEFQSAVSAFEKCANIDISFTDGLIGLALAYGELGRYEEAVEALIIVTDISPQKEYAYKLLENFKELQK